jgi:hypothetical protein
MALSTGVLPHTSVTAIGVDPEHRIGVEFVMADDSASLPVKDIVEAIRGALRASPLVDAGQPIVAVYKTVHSQEVP